MRGVKAIVADHPLVASKLTLLRDERTAQPIFRGLVDELVTLLGYDATRGLRVEQVPVTTPVAAATGVALSRPVPLLVPILRAGLGMLPGMQALLPTAETGFLGMRRDETTLMPESYAERLPEDLRGRQCYVLDPMLATGGSLAAVLEVLYARGAEDITAICLIGAPEGLATIEKAFQGRPLTVVLGALDERLNERGYIVPGLGDAGDRLFGRVD